MPANAAVALKPGLRSEELLELTRDVVDEGASIHLISLIQVSGDVDVHQRLNAASLELNRLAGELTEQGFDVNTTVQVATTGLGAQLARIASKMGCDLIVIGLVKRTKVGKALLGSDAQSVLMSAECPVLAARL